MLVSWASTQFQPTRLGLKPKFGCNLKVITRQISTRLYILGWNLVEFEKSKIPMNIAFLNPNSTGFKNLGCNQYSIQASWNFRVVIWMSCNQFYSA
jgi:hypothetical protein